MDLAAVTALHLFGICSKHFQGKTARCTVVIRKELRGDLCLCLIWLQISEALPTPQMCSAIQLGLFMKQLAATSIKDSDRYERHVQVCTLRGRRVPITSFTVLV